MNRLEELSVLIKEQKRRIEKSSEMTNELSLMSGDYSSLIAVKEDIKELENYLKEYLTLKT